MYKYLGVLLVLIDANIAVAHEFKCERIFDNYGGGGNLKYTKGWTGISGGDYMRPPLNFRLTGINSKTRSGLEYQRGYCSN